MPFSRLFYHFVWATKDRIPTIGDNDSVALAESFTRTLADMGAHQHAVGFMPDHVHIVVSPPPKIAPSDVARLLKGASSHAVNLTREPEERFGWQREYGVFSIGERSLSTVVRYVERQREHHANGEIWHALEQTEDDS